MTTTQTERGRAKADRRTAILREAARLFAAQGFAAVTVEDLGAAVGVSGPAVYRHFPSKQALLDELLVGVSMRLRDGGAAVASEFDTPEAQLRALVAFHTRFALDDADVIRVQDRDLAELSAQARADVRAAQLAYISQWSDVLSGCIALEPERRTLRVRAVFGLINSTPHSARGGLDRDATDAELQRIALSALLASA